MGYPYIIHLSKQKTSTSKPKVRFSRKKRKRKREKVCFSLVWCRWFTQKWLDGHAWMGRRDGSRKRRSDRSWPVVWGRLAVILQRANVRILANRQPYRPPPIIDGVL